MTDVRLVLRSCHAAGRATASDEACIAAVTPGDSLALAHGERVRVAREGDVLRPQPAPAGLDPNEASIAVWHADVVRPIDADGAGDGSVTAGEREAIEGELRSYYQTVAQVGPMDVFQRVEADVDGDGVGDVLYAFRPARPAAQRNDPGGCAVRLSRAPERPVLIGAAQGGRCFLAATLDVDGDARSEIWVVHRSHASTWEEIVRWERGEFRRLE